MRIALSGTYFLIKQMDPGPGPGFAKPG
jgi:hypothetical protein